MCRPTYCLLTSTCSYLDPADIARLARTDSIRRADVLASPFNKVDDDSGCASSRNAGCRATLHTLFVMQKQNIWSVGSAEYRWAHLYCGTALVVLSFDLNICPLAAIHGASSCSRSEEHTSELQSRF